MFTRRLNVRLSVNARKLKSVTASGPGCCVEYNVNQSLLRCFGMNLGWSFYCPDRYQGLDTIFTELSLLLKRHTVNAAVWPSITNYQSYGSTNGHSKKVEKFRNDSI